MSKYDTVIIGAGITGLTSAINLAEQGQKVLVVEAGRRPGGRAKSKILSSGHVFDLGAHWFHGADANPFFQWANARYDLGPLNRDTGSSGSIALRGGEDITGSFDQALETLTQTYERFARKNPKKDTSLGALARQTKSKDVQDMAEFWAQLWMAGDDADTISANDFFNDPLGSGGWQMQKGMSHLIDQIAGEFERHDGKIVLGQQVKSVRKKGMGARVETVSGDVYKASSCIVTTSMGALQNGTILFDPDVKRTIARTFNGLTMGHFHKLAVPMDLEFLESREIPDNYRIRLLDSPHRYVHAHTAGNPMSMILTGGALARAMEKWDAEKTREFVFETIRSVPCFEGFEQNLAGPIQTPPNWSSRKNYQGSYIVAGPGCKKSDPFQSGGIFFAGEALVSDPLNSPGQMAGAWYSGTKVSGMVLAYLSGRDVEKKAGKVASKDKEGPEKHYAP
jgi:polyamine oxidase